MIYINTVTLIAVLRSAYVANRNAFRIIARVKCNNAKREAMRRIAKQYNAITKELKEYEKCGLLYSSVAYRGVALPIIERKLER